MTALRIAILTLVAVGGTIALAACDNEAGRKQETVGKVESGVGKIVGDKDLKNEGREDKVAGEVKQGDLRGAVKDATN